MSGESDSKRPVADSEDAKAVMTLALAPGAGAGGVPRGRRSLDRKCGPIGSLRQQEYWLPSAERGCVVRMPGLSIREGGWVWAVPWAGSALRGYMWFQTLAGWTLALFLVAGLSGLIKHKPSASAAVSTSN